MVINRSNQQDREQTAPSSQSGWEDEMEEEGVKWSDSGEKNINILNPCFMTKLNIYAQSTQNSFANISYRIFFSYLLIVITHKHRRRGRGSRRTEQPENRERREREQKPQPSFCSSFRSNSKSV